MCRSYKTSNSFLPRSKYPDIVEYLDNVCDNQSDFIRDAIVYYWENSFKGKVAQKIISIKNESPKMASIAETTSNEVIPVDSRTKEDMDYLLDGL